MDGNTALKVGKRRLSHQGTSNPVCLYLVCITRTQKVRMKAGPHSLETGLGEVEGKSAQVTRVGRAQGAEAGPERPGPPG